MFRGFSSSAVTKKKDNQKKENDDDSKQNRNKRAIKGGDDQEEEETSNLSKQQPPQHNVEEPELVQPMTNNKRVSFVASSRTSSSGVSTGGDGDGDAAQVDEKSDDGKPKAKATPAKSYNTTRNNNEYYEDEEQRRRRESQCCLPCGSGGGGGYSNRLSPSSVTYHLYTAFSTGAVLVSFALLILNCLSFSLLKRGQFFADDVCRVFCIGMAILFMLVELPLTHFLMKPTGLQPWTVRGFLYMYTAAVSAQVAEASLYHELKIPTMTEQLTVVIIQWNSIILFAIGCVYFILGFFCMKGVVENMVHHYQDQQQQQSSPQQHDSHSSPATESTPLV